MVAVRPLLGGWTPLDEGGVHEVADPVLLASGPRTYRLRHHGRPSRSTRSNRPVHLDENDDLQVHALPEFSMTTEVKASHPPEPCGCHDAEYEGHPDDVVMGNDKVSAAMEILQKIYVAVMTNAASARTATPTPE